MNTLPANTQSPSTPDSRLLNPPYKMSPIARRRLFDLLEQGDYRQQPCTWITAAAGYGKTSLLLSYLDHSQKPYLWYTLRPADTDLMRFFQHLTQALKKQLPELELPEISLFNLAGPEAFGEVFFTAVNTTPITLVLDDYHHLSTDSLVHSAISSGIEQLEMGRWLIASRGLPPPALTRLVANDVIDLITTDALRFTFEEIEQLLSQYNLDKLSIENVHLLHTLSEGWVAGLILLIKQQQTGRLLQPSDGLVFGYFKHEILSQFDTATRQFLIICALIPDITPAQASVLTGKNDAEQRLESVVNVCAFIKCISGTPITYRFHALFRDVLWEMSSNELSIETLTDLKQRAVELQIAQGQLDAAFELLVDLNDWARLIKLIETQAEILLAHGRTHTLKTWIKAVPIEVAKQVIWLSYWEVLCDLPFSPADNRNQLEDILSRFKQVHNSMGVYLTWSYIVESYFIERNEVQPLDHWLLELEELQQNYALPDDPSIRARVIYARYIIVVIRSNAVDNRLDDEMVSLLNSSLPADQKVAYASMIIFRISWLAKGRERCNKVQAIIRQLILAGKVSPMEHFVWNMSQIVYDYLFAEHPPSLSKSLIEAREIGEQHGLKMLWDTYQLVVAQTLCIEGKGKQAEQILGTLQTGFCNTNLNNNSHLKLVHAHCHLAKNQMDEAMRYSEQALQTSLHINPIAKAQCCLSIAQAALGKRDWQKVLKSLAQVRLISRRIDNHNLEFSARILLASYALQTKKTQRGQNILRLAFSLGNAQRYRRYFMQTPDILAYLCAVALNNNIDPEYARTLIETNQLVAPRDMHCETWPWPVRIMALGPFKVEINGESLVFQGKAQAKPMAMLKALIFNAGNPVRAEQLAAALWPDANENKAKVNTKSTLHRLRKLLGHNVVELREGRLHLNPDCCWLDLVAFRNLMDRANNSPLSTTELESCLSLYRGPLLQEDALSDSATYLRLELRTFFLNNIQILAQRLFANDSQNQAISCLLHGLELEPLGEQLALELIKLYLKLNRRTDALSFYHSFRDYMIKDLGVEPSAELENLLA